MTLMGSIMIKNTFAQSYLRSRYLWLEVNAEEMQKLREEYFIQGIKDEGNSEDRSSMNAHEYA